VVWHNRRWRCREAMCARQSFTESIPELPSGVRTARRLQEAIAAAVGDANRAVSEVAEAFGVSWPTAYTAFGTGARTAYRFRRTSTSPRQRSPSPRTTSSAFIRHARIAEEQAAKFWHRIEQVIHEFDRLPLRRHGLRFAVGLYPMLDYPTLSPRPTTRTDAPRSPSTDLSCGLVGTTGLEEFGEDSRRTSTHA